MADLGTLMASLGADLTPLVQSVVLAQAEFEKYQKNGKAALDNEGVICMNTLFVELGKDKRIIKP